MSPPNPPFLYDLLNGRQRILLNAVGKRANPGGQEPFETAAVSRSYKDGVFGRDIPLPQMSANKIKQLNIYLKIM